MKARIGIVLLAVYIASIVLANWLVTRYGLIGIGFGLSATAGTLAVGGAVMTRDLVQDALGRMAIVGAIVAGAGISYGMSDHRIALASGVTFLLAEGLELLVYTPLRRRVGWGTGKWGGIVGLANATGIAADTFIFLSLAGFPVTGPVVLGQLVAKAYVTAAVIVAGVVIRRSVLRQSVVPANT